MTDTITVPVEPTETMCVSGRLALNISNEYAAELMLIGITRVRNEALIIADTLEHFLGYCDSIILYDDASTDATLDIVRQVGRDRVHIIRNLQWREDRPAEETRHRAALLKHAQAIGAEWCLCFDADERLVGKLPPLEGPGYRFRLFDGYLGLEREVHQPYTGGPLIDLPRLWGPEYRDIAMLFPTHDAKYLGRDQREPLLTSTRQADVLVKHYGKCLSVEHWEETCDYYATHWPEPYRSKWAARRGRAIHTASDFGQPLFTWDNLLERHDCWRKL